MIISLVSGGMDSFVGTKMLDHQFPDEEIIPLYFDHHSKPSKIESALVKKQYGTRLQTSGIFSFKKIEEESSFIHGRNLHFLTAASRYSNKIALHGHKTSSFLDNTAKFRMNAASVLSIMKGEGVTIISPIAELTKEEIVDHYVNNLGDIDDLVDLTSSCSEGKHFCGKCWHCFSFYCCLWKHLDKATEPPVFTNKEIVLQYYEKAKAGEFDRRRRNVIARIYEEEFSK